MKKTLLLLALFIFFVGCHREDLSIPYGNLKIQVNFENSYANFPKENITVQITEQNGTLVQESQTNSNGIAVFANIVNDVYKVRIKHTFSKNIVFSIIGVQNNLTFIGETNSLLVSVNKTNEETVILKTNRIGGFVIKEVYNSNAGGGSFSDGIYQYIRFNDAFFEIYNNSPESLYADGLQIGIATNVYENEWQNDSENAYVEQIFKINGNGKQYPVLPGKSIIVASTAINHIGASGLTQDQINDLYLFGTVNKSVDLSGADFETYFNGFATNFDVDVANVPNLEVQFNAYPTIKEIVTTNRGISLIIFNDENINSFETVQVKRGNITKRTYKYKKVPISVVIDAFEAQINRKFPSTIIGEELSVLKAWEGKSYRRKTSTTVGNRRVLLDTNNCVADFEELDHATPDSF